jgi:hypothetical protein
VPRPASIDPAQLRLRLQAGGPSSAQELADAVGVDRRTVQRALATLGEDIEQLGRTRNTRYAARRAIHGQSTRIPIARFGVNGIAHPWATLTALHGGWRLEWASRAMQPDWADQVHDHAGFCEGLPFFAADLRPQGFLGRGIARRLPTAFGLPADPRDWSDEHTVFFLREWGDDLPGNLVFGAAPTVQALGASPENPVTPETRSSRYPALADAANAGEATGSSVEGEQPKFTAWLQNAPAQNTLAVLVKFTDRLDTPSGRRWADLLAAEALALDVLTSASRSDAEAFLPAVFDFDDRRFYELARYDRVGAHGRRGVVSLRALHDAGFTGRETSDWVVAATGLHARGWISESDLRAVRVRALFGRLIGNTDMHFGNLSFFLDLGLPLALTPTYDMLPMLWAPRVGEAIPAPEFTPLAPMPQELDLWSEVAPLAEQFWKRVESDSRVSDGFRPHATAALRAVQTLRGRFG